MNLKRKTSIIVLIAINLLLSVNLYAQTSTMIRDGAANVIASVKAAGVVTPNVMGVQGNANGVPIPITVSSSTDPCGSSTTTKVSIPISISTATTTEIIDASASNKAYICSIVLYTDAANDVGIVEDANNTCASPDAGIFGGTSAATGFNFAANQGFVAAGGNGTVTKTQSTNVNVCIITSAATQLNGAITYALAP